MGRADRRYAPSAPAERLMDTNIHAVGILGRFSKYIHLFASKIAASRHLRCDSHTVVQDEYISPQLYLGGIIITDNLMR